MTLKRRLLGLVVTFAMLSPNSAYAHTALISSNPKNNAVLQKAPTAITLNFNEPLIKISGREVSRVSLIDGKGKRIKLGQLKITKGQLVAPIMANPLSKGSYQITYRIVSNDGHPVTGTIRFSLK